MYRHLKGRKRQYLHSRNVGLTFLLLQAKMHPQTDLRIGIWVYDFEVQKEF